MQRPFIFIIALVLAPAAAAAQASSYLPLDHPVYSQLIRLEQLTGQRLGLHRGPLTRSEVANALARLNLNADSVLVKSSADELPPDLLAADVARRIMAELTVRPRWVDGLSLSMLATNSRANGYEQNGLGQIVARNNPLLSTQSGVRRGVPAVVRSDHFFRPLSMVAIGIEPEIQISDAGADDTRFVLQQGYARLVGAGLALDAGRVRREWGPSRKGGLLLSGNARAPWSVGLGSEGEFRLPSLLRLIGPTDFEVFWADLGEQQTFPGANLFGWRAGFRPLPALSLGAQLLMQYGGKGAPAFDASTFIKDVALPFLKSNTDVQFSNKLAGIDFELRVQRAAGLTIYGELMLDDVDTNPDRFRGWIREDVGHVYGIQLDGLERAGAVSAFAEFQHTGHRFYRHHQFLTGLTYDGSILGSPLGPDGDALYTGVARQISMSDRIGFEGALERRSNDIYSMGDNGHFADDEGFIRVEDRPDETRLRGIVEWRHAPGRLGYEIRAGVERVVNEAFAQRSARMNYLVEIKAEARFR